ncbi:MAG: phospho-N-acetylmuramoyl-pentapeptide-transferase [Lachnospiraceae bacterium]|nr:phospho-N-acetylmuramoyl-pentapeptide-transferase [Lachnospiraceae bacterium]
MLYYCFGYDHIISLLGIAFAFFTTFFSTKFLMKYLPLDRGKEYAHDGQASKGKPQGAGLFFVLSFIVSYLIFGPVDLEFFVYLILMAGCMVTGFLDDKAVMPWGRVKKGLLDLGIAVLVAVNYIWFNGSDVTFILFGYNTVHFPVIIMGIVIVAAVWGMINVTNCADGVDGLSASLSIVTLLSIYRVLTFEGIERSDGYHIILFVVCLLAYLWFNAFKSILMMGDAGSRAMGFFLAIAAMKTGSIFIIIPLAVMIILDGGLGLVKITLIKTCKIHIFKNITFPLHDHVRKKMGWENMHCVFRFMIIQAVVNILFIFLVF